MKKWEYELLTWHMGTRDVGGQVWQTDDARIKEPDLLAALNLLGEEGWEVAESNRHAPGHGFVLKRPKA